MSEELCSSLVYDLLSIPESLQEPCEISIKQPFVFYSSSSPAAFGLLSNLLYLAEFDMVNKVNALKGDTAQTKLAATHSARFYQFSLPSWLINPVFQSCF